MSARQKDEQADARRVTSQLLSNRYDPTAENAADMEMKPKAVKVKGRQQSEMDVDHFSPDAASSSAGTTTVVPEVSKERFITIKSDLKEAIKPASGDWKKMEEVSSFSFFGTPAVEESARVSGVTESVSDSSAPVTALDATAGAGGAFSFSSSVNRDETVR